MKGGRLRIVNESSYPTDEVEALVRFGLGEISIPGQGLVVIVKHTRPSKRRMRGACSFSGLAYSLRDGIPTTLYNRYIGRRRIQHLVICRVGRPENPNLFPTRAWIREQPEEMFWTWQEGLVGITAHEGMHVQHAYDGAYGTKSGRRTITRHGGVKIDPDGSARTITRKRIVSVRVGVERIEPKCEAHEAYMLRKFRKMHYLEDRVTELQGVFESGYRTLIEQATQTK